MNKTTIIKQSIQVFDQYLTESVKSAVLIVLKSLFSKAESAKSNQQEQNFFSWYRQLKEEGKSLLSAVKEEMRLMPDFISKHLESQQEPAVLSLVAEEELSITLALTQLDSSLEVIGHAELYTLEKRMNVLYGSGQLDQSNMPFSPPALIWALSNALNRMEMDVEVKVMVIETLNKELSKQIVDIYHQINSIFITAGILPNIKPQFTTPAKQSRISSEQNKDPVASPESKRSDGSQVEGTATQYDAKTQELVQSIFEMLRPNHAAQTNKVAEIKKDEFDQALEQISKQVSVNASSQNVSQLKEQLSDQVKNNTGNFYPQFSPIQSNTMDLMGMVYDEIGSDKRLDSNIKSSFNAINIPLIRLAVSDDTFFTDENHSARRYIEMLIKSSHQWYGTEVIRKVHQFSDAAAKSFDGSKAAFDKALLNLEEYLHIKEKRADHAERKWVSAAKGQEKMEITKGKVQKHMDQWLSICEIPFLKDVLKNVWEDALTLTLLREGEQSDIWHKKLRAAETLSKLGNQDTIKLLKGGEKLQALHMLDETMDELGFSVRDRQNTKDNIHACLAWNEQSEDSEGGVLIPDLKKVLSIEEAKSGGKKDKEEHSGKKIEDIRELTEQELNEMERLIATPYGTLFDFHYKQGDKVRKKLSWVSTLSQRILFVDLTGKQPDKQDLRRVAIDVTRGTIQAVEKQTQSYFQKALSNVFARVKKIRSS